MRFWQTGLIERQISPIQALPRPVFLGAFMDAVSHHVGRRSSWQAETRQTKSRMLGWLSCSRKPIASQGHSGDTQSFDR
jgi:hypothetical protein